MTEQDTESVKALFDAADLDDVPITRDLVGPAVAWGYGRRRRDRWTAVGVTGAVAAVAVAGVVALRPGGGSEQVGAGGTWTTHGTSKPPTPTTTPTLPKLSGSYAQKEQELLDALKPYLPPGYRITCQDLVHDGSCTMMTFTGPAGTSIGQWNFEDGFYESGPADTHYIHQHKPTPEIPLVSGSVRVPGGTVKVQSLDTEAQDNVGDKAMLNDPTALVFHTAGYVFIPAGSGEPVSLELGELVREMPWKGVAPFSGEHDMWGFNTTGPVLSPQQFGALVTAPIFPELLHQLLDVEGQARDAQRSLQHSPTSSSPH